jgi:hypothetical protein
MFSSGGTSSFNIINVLKGSSVMGVYSNGHFVPGELRSEGSCVEQNRLLVGSPPVLAITPTPQCQNLLPTQTGGRVTGEHNSALNQDLLNNEGQSGLVNLLHFRAQTKPSIQDNSIIHPSTRDWMAMGANSSFLPIEFQTEHSYDSGARDLPSSEEKEGFSFGKYAREAPPIWSARGTSLQQQPCWNFGGHLQFQEERQVHANATQEEKTTPSNSFASCGRTPSPRYKRESRDEKKSACNKLDKNRLRKECIELYGLQAPLHFAIQMNHINALRQLLKRTNPNIYHGETGETPMHLACRLGKLDIVKLLRRHPKIDMNLKTISGTKAVSPAGQRAVQLAYKSGKFNVVNFLASFMRKDHIRVELSPTADELKIEQEVIKQELNKLKPKIDILKKENEELKKKIRELQVEDVVVMGKKLPRNKPTDTKKLADVIKKVRELQSDLIARQQRIWSEREDDKQCTICTERPKNTVLVPCGHFFCSVCSRTVEQCPICRRCIERRIKTFK